MRTKDTIQDEVDAIRDRIYEKIKDMTPEEECDYFNSRARETFRRMGIPFRPAEPVLKRYTRPD